jgi:hypothetical protein
MRYRNPSLLGAWSRKLSDRRRGALADLRGDQLSAVACALAELSWPHGRLLDAVAGEAAERIIRAENPAPTPHQDSLRTLGAADIAAIACSLAVLGHRHKLLLTHACNAAVVAACNGGGGWGAADVAAVAWTAAVFRTGPAALLEAAAAAAAEACRSGTLAPAQAPLVLVRLAWACVAFEVRDGSDDSDGGASNPLAELVPLLGERVAPLLQGEQGAAWLRRLGPELLQLAQDLRAPGKPAVQLLPPALEAAAVEAAAAAAREGERGATLSAVAAVLEALGHGRAASASSAGAAPARVLVGHPVPGTLLVADVAVLRDSQPPVAVLFADAAAFDGDGRALAPARVSQAHFERAGWRVAWLRAEQWAEDGNARERRRLVSEALAGASAVV